MTTPMTFAKHPLLRCGRLALEGPVSSRAGVWVFKLAQTKVVRRVSPIRMAVAGAGWGTQDVHLPKVNGSHHRIQSHLSFLMCHWSYVNCLSFTQTAEVAAGAIENGT